MKTKLKTTLALLAAVCGLNAFVATTAWAAYSNSKPVVVWDHDFGTTTKGDYSITLGSGNTVQPDGSILIGQDATVGVKISGGNIYTVVIKASGYTPTTSDKTEVIVAMLNSNNSFVGLGLRSDKKCYGIWNDGTYSDASPAKEQTVIQGTEAHTYTVSYKYDASSPITQGTRIYVDGSLMKGATGWRGSGLANATSITIGGPQGSQNLAVAKGLKIEGIAIFSDTFLAADTSSTYKFPSDTDNLYSSLDDFSYAKGIYVTCGTGELAANGRFYTHIDQTTKKPTAVYMANNMTYPANTVPNSTVAGLFWPALCYSSGASAQHYAKPGSVLVFPVGTGSGIGGTFGPLTLGGVYVPAGATSYSLSQSGSGRRTIFGDPDGGSTLFRIADNFAVQRNGEFYFVGNVTLDVAADKTFTLQTSYASYQPGVYGSVPSQPSASGVTTSNGGAIVLKGDGKVTVTTLSVKNTATIDYSNQSVSRTSAYINGTLAIDDSTVIKLPAGLTAGTAFPLATTLSGANNGVRQIWVGGQQLTKSVVFSDGKITYNDILDFTAYTTGGNFSEIQWTPDPSGAFTQSANLTLTNTATATVTFDKAVTAGKLKIVNDSDKPLTLATISNASILAYDFSEAAGGVKIDCTGIEGGEKTILTATITGAGNVSGVNVPSGYVFKADATGFHLRIAENGSRVNPVTGDTYSDFKFYFVGSTSTDWITFGNWRTCADGALTTYAESHYPQHADGPYDPVVIDGNLIPAERRAVSMTSAIEGWNIRLAVLNGANVTVQQIDKVAGGSLGNWIWVDATSSITFASLGSKNTVSDVSYYVANANGVTFSSQFTKGKTYSYYLKGLGSVNYAAGITAGTHKIKQFQLVMGSGDNKIIKTQALVTFASCTPNFTVEDSVTTDTGDTATKLSHAPTLDDTFGSYFVTKEAAGYYVTFVGRTDKTELTWDNTDQVWKKHDGTVATPDANSILALNDGDNITFGSTVSPYAVNMPLHGTVTFNDQNNLTFASIDIPGGATLVLGANAAPGFNVTGAGTLKYGTGLNDATIVAAEKLANFNGTFWMTSGRHKYSEAIASSVTVKVTDGAVLWLNGGSWANHFEISGQGWKKNTNNDKIEYCAVRFEGNYIADGATINFTTVDDVLPAIGKVGGTITLGCTLTGGGFAKFGSNELVLSKPKTQVSGLTGPVSVAYGTLRYGNDNYNENIDYTLGSGVTVESGATFRVHLCQYGSDTVDEEGKPHFETPIVLKGGSLKKYDGSVVYASIDVQADSSLKAGDWGKRDMIRSLSGSHKLTLTADGAAKVGVFGGTFTGTLYLNSSNVNLYPKNDALQNATVQVASGHVKLVDAAVTLGALTGGGDLTTEVAASALTVKGGTYSGVISGAVSMVIAGDVTLSGANTFTGGLTVQSGILKVTTTDPLSTGTITVNAGAKIDFDGLRNITGKTFAGTGTLKFLLSDAEIAAGTELTLVTQQDLPNTIEVRDEFGQKYAVTSSEGVYKVSSFTPQATDIMSVNFNSVKSDRKGKLIDNDKMAGVIAVQGINWTQLNVPNGSFTSNAVGAVIKELLADGTVDRGAMKVSYSGATAYTRGGTDPSSGNGQLTFGYIDDGDNPASTSYGAEVKVENIPYSEYSVIVYIGSDGTGAIGPLTINDTVYGSPSWGERSKTHESGGVITWERNGNYLLVSGLTGSTLTVRGAKNGSPSGTRCGIAGIQVLNSGVRTLPTYTTPYSASATADSDAADLDWTDASSPAKYVAYSAVKAATANQLTVASGKTVTFDINLSKATGPGTFKKVGTGERTLTKADKTNKPAAIEVTGGKLTFGNGQFFTATGENQTFPLTISGGELDLNGAWSFANDNSGWLTQKPITLGGTTATKISGGNVTFYENNIPDSNAIIYRGNNGANAAAEFAASWHGSYSHSKDYPRNILVEKGAGAEYDLLISGTFGLSGGDYSSTKITKTGAGTVYMTGAFNFPYLTIAAGTWKMGSQNAIAANTTIGDNGTLDLNGYTFSLNTLSGTGAFVNSSDTQSTVTNAWGTKFNGTITGKIKVVVNGGTLDLTDATIGDDVTFEYNITDTAAGCGIILPTGKSNPISSTGSSDRYKLENGIVVPKTAITTLRDTLIWLPIGDSITEGEVDMGHTDRGSVDSRGGYRYQLWSQLEASDQPTRSVGYRTGHSGTVEADNLVWAWHAAQYGGVIAFDNANAKHGAALFNVENTLDVAGYPDVITVLMGVNDLSFSGTTAGVYASMDAMVKKLAAMRPRSKILVATLLPAGPSGTTPRLNYILPYNTMLREKSQAGESPFNLPNVKLIDLYTQFGEYAEGYFRSDHLHPNEKGAVRVARAFSGFVETEIAAIAAENARMVNVHNGEGTNIVVRFSKALNSDVVASLTITGTDVNSNAVSRTFNTGSVDADDARVMKFEIGEGVVLTGGVYTATLAVTSGTAKDGTSIDGSALGSAFVDIQGSGAAANVDAAFRAGFQRYETVSLGNGTISASGIGSGDNWAGNGPSAEQIVMGDVRSHFIKRIGYYVELKREGEPAQFMWVSMNAFTNDVTKAGIPTTLSGIHKSVVTNLQVYANRATIGNTPVDAAGVDTNATGIVEFTPWSWGGADVSGYPGDMYAGKTGWNDTLTDTTTLAGGMQVARYTGEASPDKYSKFAAEMLFSFNNFNRATETDIGFGSFPVNRNNAGGDIGTDNTWDWSNFINKTGYRKFAVNAYEVKKIEIWVEVDADYVFKANVGANAKWSELKWTNGKGEPAELQDNAEVILTATAADSSLEIDRAVTQAIFTVLGGADKNIAITKGDVSVDVGEFDLSEFAGEATLSFATGDAKVIAGVNTHLGGNVNTLVVASGKKAVLKDGVTATTYDVAAGATIRLEGARTDGYTTVTGVTNNFQNANLSISATPTATIRDSGTLVRVGIGDQFSIVGAGNDSADAIGWNIVNEGGTVTFTTNAPGKSTWVGRKDRFYRQTAGTMTAQTTVDSMSTADKQYVGFMLNYQGSQAFTFDVSGGTVNIPYAVLNYGESNAADVYLSGDAVMTVKGIRKARSGTTVGGTFTMSDTATLRLGSCGIAANAATFTLNGGTIVATDDTTISAALAIPGDVTLEAEATKTLTIAGALTGSGKITKTGLGAVKFPATMADRTLAITEGTVSFQLTAQQVEDFGRGKVELFTAASEPPKDSVEVYDNNGIKLEADFVFEDGKVKAKVHVEAFTLTPDKSGEFVWNVGSLFDGSKAYTAFGDVTFNTTAYTTAVTNSALVNASAVKLGGTYSFAGSPLVANDVATIAGAKATFTNDVVASNVTVDRGVVEFASLTADEVEVAGATFGAKVVGPSMRYVRLKITATQGGGNNCPAVAEFRLYRGSAATGYTTVDWPRGTKVTEGYGTPTTVNKTATKEGDTYPGVVGDSNECQPGCLIDGYYGDSEVVVPYTKPDNTRYTKLNKWWMDGKASPWVVTIEFPYPVATFTGCNFCLADHSPRNPTAWTIEVSSDGKNWTEINNMSGATWTTQFAWNGGDEHVPAFLNSDVHPTQIALGAGAVVKVEGNWTADITISGAVTNRAVTGETLTLDTNSSTTFEDGATVTFDLSGLDIDDYEKHYILGGKTDDWPAVDDAKVIVYDTEDRFYFTKDAGGYAVTLKREAKIGTTYYFTLLKALNAATEGQTVTLCTNVAMTAAYELDKSITLDGDIYEITGEGFTGSGKLTIAGGFIGVTTLPGSRSLVGGKYKDESWTAETGYHYADMASSEITGYAKQIIAGQSGQAGEKAYPITDGGETYQGDLAFTKDELVQKGIVTAEATDLQIAEALNTSGANGRPTWENVVLGLRNDEALAKPVPTPVQGTDPTKLKLKLDNLKVSTTSGAKITYKVTTTTSAGSETKTIDDLEAEFALPQSGVSYYKFEVTVTPAK